jgi:UDP-N-acetylmuramate dehydrogenase
MQNRGTGSPGEEDRRLREALTDVQGEMVWGVPLSTLTSLQIGGPADVLVFPKDVPDVLRVMLGARSRRIPVVVLGGTNVVVRDKGIRGIVVNLKNLASCEKGIA